jgi:hypothetical protein
MTKFVLWQPTNSYPVEARGVTPSSLDFTHGCRVCFGGARLATSMRFTQLSSCTRDFFVTHSCLYLVSDRLRSYISMRGTPESAFVRALDTKGSATQYSVFCGGTQLPPATLIENRAFENACLACGRSGNYNVPNGDLMYTYEKSDWCTDEPFYSTYEWYGPTRMDTPVAIPGPYLITELQFYQEVKQNFKIGILPVPVSITEP